MYKLIIISLTFLHVVVSLGYHSCSQILNDYFIRGYTFSNVSLIMIIKWYDDVQFCLMPDNRHCIVGKSFTSFSTKSRVWSYLRAIYICMRGLYKLGENKGKKERRRCGEQISVALAYDLRGKGSILLICYRRVENIEIEGSTKEWLYVLPCEIGPIFLAFNRKIS